MAVAHDAATESTYTTTSPHEFTHTPVGTPRGIGVAIVVNAAEVPATAVSYGGVDMGAAVVNAQDTAGEAGRAYIWFLGENVLPGAQTVSITHAGSATTKHVVVFSVTANRSVEVVDSDTDTADQANPSIALDSGTATALRYGALFSGHDAIASITLGASMSAMENHDFGSQMSRVDRQTTASSGSFTIQYTATSEDVAYAGIAVAEVDTVLFDGVAVCVEAAFGYGPTDTPGWFDLTDRCRELSFSRGRSHELDTIQAGTASFILDNQDGALNANNTTSEFYPNVKPMVPIRITADYSGTAFPLWYGFVEGWPVSFPGQTDSIVTVSAVDLFKLLSLATMPTSQAEVVMALNPEAYWRFAGNPGTSDETANTHTLSFVNTPTIEQAGVWTDDESVDFNHASSEHATVASETVLEYVDEDLTVAAWVNLDGGKSMTVMGAFETSGFMQPSWELYWDFGTESFRWRQAGNSVAGPGHVAGSWVHIAASREWDGGTATIRFYLNGEPANVETSTATAGAATRTVYIARDAAELRYMNGKISELAVWGSVLTAAQISSIYNSQIELAGSELTSERIAALLTEAGFTNYDLETGNTTMAAATSTEGSVLDQITDAVDTEGGLFFIAGNGQPRFHDRHWRTVDQATPIDEFDDSTGLPYSDIVPSYDDTQIWNEIQVTANGGSPYTVTDTTSIASYGRRTLTFDTYPLDENEVADRANWTLGLYKEPAVRIDTLVCKPRGDAALWPILLDAEISNRYTVSKALAGDDLSQDVYLEAISFHFLPKDCTVTLQLSPATSQQFWLLGEAGFSELDETTILSY